MFYQVSNLDPFFGIGSFVSTHLLYSQFFSSNKKGKYDLCVATLLWIVCAPSHKHETSIR